MAAFADITAEVAYLRDREKEALKALSDGEISALYLVSARGELELDLCERLRLIVGDADTTTILDELATDASTVKHIKRALAILQLAFVFANRAKSEINVEKARDYRKEYRALKDDFPALRTRKSGRGRSRVRTRGY